LREEVAAAAAEVAAAEQQQFREEATARHAEREEAARQAVIAEYAARDCPCCPGEIENRTDKQQELIDFSRTGGIHSDFDDDAIQISASFHPQELFNELAIHMANNTFNDYNTEELVR
jgi:hypothetical protein